MTRFSEDLRDCGHEIDMALREKGIPHEDLGAERHGGTEKDDVVLGRPQGHLYSDYVRKLGKSADRRDV